MAKSGARLCRLSKLRGGFKKKTATRFTNITASGLVSIVATVKELGCFMFAGYVPSTDTTQERVGDWNVTMSK